MIPQRIIPEFRERAGLSIAEAYQAIGLEPDEYKRYEEGEAAIPLDVLYRMSSCFGVTVEATLQGGSPRARVRIEYEPNGEIKVLLEELDSPTERKPVEDWDEGPGETGGRKRGRRVVRKPLDADDIPAARKILDWQPRHVTGLT
ncbi:MAG: helix-turn-helix transcriptional regulator, partial [Treponema sp.]|nr:helix-turn-helix transcriptional regulator [Treponema sp.]